ncbi:MAG TPA: AAA family ATPase, partial [Gemmatimonadaceae bacterium]
NTLLQLLDDGRLTDGQGRTVDFRNTVVIMTSNVGSGGTPEDVMDAVRLHFRPEFINRIDEIVVFHSLDREHLRSIVDIQLSRLARRLEDRKIRLELTGAAKDLLIEEGYDPAYGARPLKRTIQRKLLDPLALKVLEGHFGEGDTIRIDASGGELTFARTETVGAR